MTTKQSTETLIIWRFNDGKPGHEKQTLGLVKALARDYKIELIDFKYSSSIKVKIWNLIMGIFPEGLNAPKPDLLIGAGHETHLDLLTASRVHGGKTVVLMKPSLPYGLFDLCIIPRHDYPPKRSNIIETIGVLNAVELRPAEEKRKTGGIFLIGGESKHYNWSSERVIDQINEVVSNHPSDSWVLTNSRRTPADFMPMIANADLKQVQVFEYSKLPAGWLEKELVRAKDSWVTMDSVSMIYESLTAKCETGLIELSPKKKRKIHRNIDFLIKQNLVRISSKNACPEITKKTFEVQSLACAIHIVNQLL